MSVSRFLQLLDGDEYRCEYWPDKAGRMVAVWFWRRMRALRNKEHVELG